MTKRLRSTKERRRDETLVGECSGRCHCHEASWKILDAAAGLRRHNPKAGRKRYTTDALQFQVDLYVNYMLEWKRWDYSPLCRPTQPAVADRFGWGYRTFQRYLNRFHKEDPEVVWPPHRPACDSKTQRFLMQAIERTPAA